MTEENVLLYPLAGLFSIVLSIPLLAFWRRHGLHRMAVIFTLLGAIVASWWYFDLSEPGADMQVLMFAMTLIPAFAALVVAGLIELRVRLEHNRQRHQRRRRKSRSASTAPS